MLFDNAQRRLSPDNPARNAFKHGLYPDALCGSGCMPYEAARTGQAIAGLIKKIPGSGQTRAVMEATRCGGYRSASQP